MKPVRLKKDAVLHTVHTGPNKFRIASGAEAARTLANPNGFGWPSCMACTEKRMLEQKSNIASGRFGEGTFIPVEEYVIVDTRRKPDGNDEEDLQARCTHGNPGGRVYDETQTLTMPRTWSEVKKRQKRAALIFFAGSAAVPVGGNLVLL